ncbi:unnamed protein product [Caretta caretta]
MVEPGKSGRGGGVVVPERGSVEPGELGRVVPEQGLVEPGKPGRGGGVVVPERGLVEPGEPGRVVRFRRRRCRVTVGAAAVTGEGRGSWSGAGGALILAGATFPRRPRDSREMSDRKAAGKGAAQKGSKPASLVKKSGTASRKPGMVLPYAADMIESDLATDCASSTTAPSPFSFSSLNILNVVFTIPFWSSFPPVPS